MKTVILCGGRGTRIRDVADNLPKPMLPIGGLPILWHIMKYYAYWGHREFVLCLGFKGDVIKDFFLNYGAHTQDFTLRLGRSRPIQYHSNHKEVRWGITFAETGPDTMTGGRIGRIQRYLAGESDFMLTYGDGLSDVDIDKLLRFHRSHGKILTVSGVRPPGRFGELRSSANGTVTEFNEKPQATAGRISGGYFVCRKEIFGYLPPREDLIFEEEPIKRLVAERQVKVFEHDGFWQPMDTFRDYTYLEGLWEKKRAPLEGLVRMRDLSSVFSGKRVLVVGDTGFKGSWLSLWLHQMGANVLGYALPPRQNNDHFNLLKLGKHIRHIDGDIRDLRAFSGAVKSHRPEFLFHLAAQPLVKLSYNQPKLTFDTNVGGSVNVLEIARTTPSLRAVVYVTSDKCYRNKEWVWGYRENDELGGSDPYSASKAAAELVFTAYADSFFRDRRHFGMASVRAGNVIGGGDWSADRIVPDIVRALQKGRPITLRHPQSTRPWQHVLDPLYGYLTLASRLADDGKRYGGAWNFGPGGESNRTVHDLASAFIAGWGSGRIRNLVEKTDIHEDRLLQLNCEKARHQLQWQPRWNFSETIQRTLEWYKRVLDGESALTMSGGQIHSFREGF